MSDHLPPDRMTEAEVSLRLALQLLRSGLSAADVEVAIDGAQVQAAGRSIFQIQRFLADSRCYCAATSWQGTYAVEGAAHRLRIHAHPGRGDVVAPLATGRLLRAESKKGPLVRSRSSAEYPLMREAFGQLLTVEEVGPDDHLAIAVPHSEKFAALAGRWRMAPLIQPLGIRILLAHRHGGVDGLGALA